MESRCRRRISKTKAIRSTRLSGLFEKAWDEVPIGGEPPRIEDFLEDAPSDVRDRLRDALGHRPTLTPPDRGHDRRRRDDRLDDRSRRGRNVALDRDFDPAERCRQRRSGTTAAFSVSNLEKTLGATLDLTQAPHAHGGGLETGVEIFVSPTAGKPAQFKMFEMGGYDILDELGRGGMGVVYKARHRRLDRIVALKMVLGGGHASAEQLARFQIEAQAVAQLHDPGIVQIFEVGEHDGLPYFSLEFVEGLTLSKRIGGKPTKPDEAAEMVRDRRGDVGRAQRGIIHRDLKPANILLTIDGKPKITDFGLAKRLEGDSGRTRSGAVMGTPSYMAPEQAWGKTQEVGPLSDQYALGAILYEMLTGRPPFQGATMLETLELGRTQEPVPPSRLQPSVSADLETVCLKALEKDPRKRYESVHTFAEDLRRIIKGEPIVARPVSLSEHVWRWCAQQESRGLARDGGALNDRRHGGFERRGGEPQHS